MKRDQTCRNEHTQPHADSHPLCLSVFPHRTASEQKDVLHGSEYFTEYESRQRQEIFVSSETSRSVLGLTLPHIQWVPGGSFSVVNRLGREFSHPPPPIPKVKNEWNYTSTPLYIFMAWTGKHYLYAH
jgi:hypothetical protein